MALLGADSHLFVFVANFDGTSNEGEKAPDNEYDTLVFRFHEHLHQNPVDRLVSHYEKGIDTQKGIHKTVVEGIMGSGVLPRGTSAFSAFREFMAFSRSTNSDARFHVHINAFSRGCASALILTNRLSELSLTEPITASGLLLDAVITNVGTKPGNFVNVVGALEGSVAAADLILPPQPWPFLHLGAGGETRDHFKFHSLAERGVSETAHASNMFHVGADDGTFSRLTEVMLDGLSHGDVAGTYPGSTSRDVSEYLSCVFLQSLGIPVLPVKPGAETLANPVAAHWNGRHMWGDILLKRFRTTDRSNISRAKAPLFKLWDAIPTNAHQRIWDFARWVIKRRAPRQLDAKVMAVKAASNRAPNNTLTRAIPLTNAHLKGMHGPDAKAAFDDLVRSSKPLAPSTLRTVTQRAQLSISPTPGRSLSSGAQHPDTANAPIATTAADLRPTWSTAAGASKAQLMARDVVSASVEASSSNPEQSASF
jgi:hypothetical protein